MDSRFLEPVLSIERNADEAFVAVLEGWKQTRDGPLRYRMPSINHDWVEADQVIRRIPPDAPSIAESMLDGLDCNSLTLAQALELSRVADGLRLHLRPEVFDLTGTADLETDVSPRGLQGKLFEYQANGVAWMADRARRAGGFILADEMGLGKTIQIIALLLKFRPSPANPALIIAPTTLLTNWQQELLRFAPSFTHLLHRGSNRAGISNDLARADIVITTYDTVASDRALIESVNWRWIILDEAQAVRNPETARRKAIENIPREHMVPMTGTPVETSLRDLWSLMDLAVPGLLGNLSSFEASYTDDVAGAGALSSIVGGLILRRRVEDVAKDLPERIDIDLPIDTGVQFSDDYMTLRNRVLEKYPQAGHLVAVNQLAMLCAHHVFPDRDGMEIDEAIRLLPHSELMSPKLEATLELLQEAFANGRKVLLFSNFNGTVQLLERVAGLLPDAYWNAINGSTPQAERQEIVDAFTEFAGPACLVLNPKAAGAGLNITAATIVIHYTLYWNPALEAQASARAHRRGQTQPVRIYRLFYPDTVEEVMLERSLRRREMGDAVMEDAEAEKADLRKAIDMGRGGS
ncbi:DEAD/DEAH box helicase [Parerythrobacter jejuensis]|uniref:DEAD/DEAH box helicase n=1 Tax=Parerythrobacter jejuensis TaxID=795812 RepID=UPI002D80C8FE|nr:DEAD/DEAH box helicase [Parerythrobacter jejuensis]